LTVPSFGTSLCPLMVARTPDEQEGLRAAARERVKRALWRNGFSFEDVARRARASYRYVQYVLSGQRGAVRGKALRVMDVVRELTRRRRAA
jgi:hypothetical protein